MKMTAKTVAVPVPDVNGGQRLTVCMLKAGVSLAPSA